MDAPIRVSGHILQPGDDHDLLLGSFNLDLTNGIEQAILDITGALVNGYVLSLYPSHLAEHYAPEVELETLHFNKEKDIES